MSRNLREEIRPISYIKAHAAEVLDSINGGKVPIVITQNGEARAVLLDIESYQTMQDAFGLLSIFRIAEEEYSSGQAASLDEVAAEIQREYFAE